MTVTQEIQRLESISRSPIFSHFSETLIGTVSIRAYGACERFIVRNQRLLDANTRTGFTYHIVFNWLALRLDLLGSLLGFSVAMLAVTRSQFIPNPAYAGLALAYAFSTTGVLKEMVRSSADAGSRMNAVERLKHYSETVEQEAPALIEDKRPAADWPSQGAIRVQDLVVAYAKGTPVLKSLSLDIKPGERIGVAGRTGSGKSTLMLALLRILEAEEGSIAIDGVDVSKIGLTDLRSRVAIIPQDPALFSDTLRRNFDPFDQHTDEEVWEVLKLVNLYDYVQTLPKLLQFEVAEGGDNFSVGQRQMVRTPCFPLAVLFALSLSLSLSRSLALSPFFFLYLSHSAIAPFLRSAWAELCCASPRSCC